ncbi:MAG: hypothetical protein LRY68_11850 [Sulfurospirillum sp.]|nr:hypothetical protein [Sulfurospirillum sp.]
MINFLNEHFGALSALFILSLMIITEWKDKHAKAPVSSSNSFKASQHEMLFWIKMIVLLQSALVLFSIFNYFK